MEERILSIIQGLRNYGLEPTTIIISVDGYSKIAASTRLRDTPKGQELFGLNVEIRDDIEYEFVVE